MASISTSRKRERSHISLVETIGAARRELLRLHLLASDLRLRLWMTMAVFAAASAGCLAICGYAGSEMTGAIRPHTPTEVTTLMLMGVVFLVVTIMLGLPRISTSRILLDVARREAANLESAITDAEAEFRAVST